MPVTIPIQNVSIYTKNEFDALLNVKADKAPPSTPENIAGLTGTEGNLLDLGITIGNLIIGDVIAGGRF